MKNYTTYSDISRFNAALERLKWIQWEPSNLPKICEMICDLSGLPLNKCAHIMCSGIVIVENGKYIYKLGNSAHAISEEHYLSALGYVTIEGDKKTVQFYTVLPK